MEHKIAADHVLHGRGREAFLHRDVEVSGKDSLQQFLGFKIRNEVARDCIFFLALEISGGNRNGGRAELAAIAAPEFAAGAPDSRRIERNMHAKDDR